MKNIDHTVETLQKAVLALCNIIQTHEYSGPAVSPKLIRWNKEKHLQDLEKELKNTNPECIINMDQIHPTLEPILRAIRGENI